MSAVITHSNPAIQGLRAVAITLVILCHFSVQGFQSGFIGVDIFFVLSGFLITRLLLQEYKQTGEIRLLQFYSKRIKRLLPALMFMLFITSVLVVSLLSPAEQHKQFPGLYSAVVWLSNLQFSLSKLDYFAIETNASVVLHTWSLAVEEQFYLGWPIVVLFVCGYFSEKKILRNDKQIQKILIALIALSLSFSVLLTFAKPIWAYYLMPARIWQFACGALICTITSEQIKLVRQNINDLILGVVGIAGILLSLVVIDKDTIYPGFIALFPTASAVLLLLACLKQSNSVTKIMSLRPLVVIGDLSYSLYLWHWPFLTLAKVLMPAPSLAQQVLLMLVIIVMSLISYYLVERPIRNSTYLKNKPARVLVPTVILVCAAICIINFWEKKANVWMQDKQFNPFVAVTTDVSEVYLNNCDEWFYTSRAKACVFGDVNAAKTVVVVGDSVLLHWYPAIKAIYSPQQWRIIVITKSSCPVVNNDYFYARIGRVYHECHNWRFQLIDLIRQINPNTVIMGSSYTYPFSDEEWKQGMNSTLASISPHAKQVFLFLSSPVLPRNIPECLAREQWHKQLGINYKNACSMSSNSTERDRVNKLLINSAHGYQNVKVIDTADIACSDKQCRGMKNGIITYRDAMHLSAKYSESLYKDMRRAMYNGDTITTAE